MEEDGGNFNMIDNLLNESVVGTGLGVKLELCSIVGDTCPKIGELNKYKWDLKISGTPKYHRIKELIVVLSFMGDKLSDTHMSIEGGTPGEEEEYMGDAIFPIGPFKFVKPVKSKKVKHRRLGLGFEWVIKNIELEYATCKKDGEISVKFNLKSLDLPPDTISIALDVIAVFYEKKYIFSTKACPVHPHIRGSDVKKECKGITPIIPGKQILKYTYDLNEGTLEKGEGAKAVRNVALRAETLAIFFRKLKDDLSEEPYRRRVKGAAKEAGKQFAGELKEILGHDLTDRTRTIHEWFEYDSSVGMGKFDMPEEGIITVKNSFATYNIESDTPVCCFLEGYFEGVLSEIYTTPKSVTETSCRAKGDEVCTFKWEK